MTINNKLFGSFETGRQALNIRFEKQGLIQSNIANIETPGYTTQDFSFEKVMKSVTQNRGKLTMTHNKHMNLDPVEINEAMEFISEKRPVDLDEEMLKLSENQLMYQIATKIITKKFEGLRLAIDEGGK